MKNIFVATLFTLMTGCVHQAPELMARGSVWYQPFPEQKFCIKSMVCITPEFFYNKIFISLEIKKLQ